MKNPEQKPRSPAIGTPVLVRLQPDQIKMIDAWRREQDDLPSRAEAIRATSLFSISNQGATKKERKGKR